MASMKSLLNLTAAQINKMSRKELASVVSSLGKTANQRLTRIEQANVNTPQYQKAMREGGRFRARNKSLNQLRNEYVRVKEFLNSKTSSLRGYRQTKRDFEKRMGGNNKPLTDKQYERFWKFERKTRAISGGFNYVDRMKIAYQVFTENKYASFDDLLATYEKRLNNAYEEREGIEKEYSASQFFTM